MQNIDDLNFRDFDLEYSELLTLDWRKELNEIQMRFRFSVIGWYLKEKRNNFLRRFGLLSFVVNPCLEYEVDVLFIGVHEVRRVWSTEHLFEQAVANNNLRLDIDNARVVKMDQGVFRYYLRAEELELDFNFVDFIYRELCVRR